MPGPARPRRRGAAAVALPLPQQQGRGASWEGWGTSLAWWAHALGRRQPLRDRLAALLFAPQPAGLGLTIARYNIGGACQQQAAEYRTGGAVPCTRRPDGSYDWAADGGQLAMLAAAARAGANTIEAFVNSPPWYWTASGSSRGHKFPYKDNLLAEHVEDFAAFCADVVGYLERERGLRVASLSPFNEPSSPAWCLSAGNRQEGCFFSTRRAHEVLRALARQPALQRTDLAAFDEFCCRDTAARLRRLPPDLWPAVRRVNAHTYTSLHFFHGVFVPLLALFQDNRLWRRLLRRRLTRSPARPPPLWVSEFGTGRGPMALAEQVLRDVVALQPTAWVYWQAVEAPGSRWGLVEVPLEGEGLGGERGGERAAAAGPGAASSAAGQREHESGAEEPAAAAAAAAQPPAVVLQPAFFVMQLLVAALPVGCRVAPARGLGQCGVVAEHPGGARCSVVFLNRRRRAPRALEVDGSAWAEAATAAAAAAGAPPGCSARATVRLLDVAALRPVALGAQWPEREGEPVPAPEPPPASSGWEALVGAGEWPLLVSVPPQHLCCVDVRLS